jgi:prophage maintenance system killer protein
MSDFKSVTYSEFVWLLIRTQQQHINQGEPIPALNPQGKHSINYCLQAPFMGFGEVEFHVTFDEKAAVLFYDICKLHCLLNGNKRMAVETTIFFAYKNNRYFYVDKAVLIDIAKRVVESNPDDKENMVWWVTRVFYGGIRKRTRWMNFRLTMRILPRIFMLIIKNFPAIMRRMADDLIPFRTRRSRH